MDKEYARKLVWESLLNAEYSARYFGHLANRLQARERLITIIIGVLSSGAFVTLIGKVQLNYLPQLLSLLAAVFSITLANLKLGKASALSASIYGRWEAIKNDYELLWGQIEFLSGEDAGSRWRALEAEHKKDDETAAQEFRFDRRLAEECQKEVTRMRRLAEAV